MTTDDTTPARENVLATYARELGDKSTVQVLTPFDATDDLDRISPHLVAVPGRVDTSQPAQKELF